uniref:Uncharacterized protein MANES_01G175100 n=1 Tax=Rhizophora mucronata TaxID=61149 RepID=A0A2P2MGM9_RHIMU
MNGLGKIISPLCLRRKKTLIWMTLKLFSETQKSTM